MILLRRLAVGSTVATFMLVAIGGLVRATKSGWGCGEHWPGCNGRLVPALATRAEVIEFAHRGAAAAVVTLLGMLAVVAVWKHRDRPLFVWSSLAALGLVLVQALIGALVIKFRLQAESVVIHLLAAMSLLGLLVFISIAAMVADRRIEMNPDESLNRRAWFAAGMVLALLLVGSYTSGTGAGAAFSDWPLMDGRPVPDLGIESNAVHFLHRLLAAATGIVLVLAAAPVIRRGKVVPLAAGFARAAVALFVVEVLIGATNVWTGQNPAVVSLHLAAGALIWAVSSGMALAVQPGLEQAAARRAAPRRPVLESR